MANFQFIDDDKSLTIVFNNQEYTAAKSLIELVVKDTTVNDTLEIRSNSSRPTSFTVDLTKDTVFGVGEGSTTASQLRDALKAVFFLAEGGNGGNGGNAIDGDVYLSNLFEVEKDAQGNIIKTKSIYDFQVPPESIEVGESIKISDLGQSLSYSTKFDGKQYLLIGYEITSSGTQRPFVKHLFSPTEFEVQSLFDESQTFTTQAVFPIVSFQDVIGRTYNLKAQTNSESFRVRLIRRATNGGEDTLIVDETIPGTQSNINGFDFNLSPITDFTINTDYDLILSVEDGDTFEVLGSTINGTFLPYIKRQFGWEYSKKDLAYLEDIQNSIASVTVSTDETLTGDGTPSKPLSVANTTEGRVKVVGFWDASTNTPDISQLTLEQGEAYQVSVAGNTLLNNNDEWNELDLAVWIDTVPGNWFRVLSTEKVLSVNGKKGEVVIDKTDLELDQVDNTADIDKELSTAAINALDDKIDKGGNISELNNDSGFIDSVLVDGVTVLGDGVNTPLSSVGGGGSGQESTLLKTNILNNILVGTPNETMNPLNCFGSLKISNGQGWNYDTNGVLVPNDGVYQISFRVGFISTGQRSTPVVGLSVNGSLTGDESNYAYIRNSQSLNESACVLTTNLELNAGDTVGLQARKSGTVTAAINTYSVGSFFNIEQISGPKDTNGVSNINDLSDVDALNPLIDQGLIWNGIKWIPSFISGGGGNSKIIFNGGFLTNQTITANGDTILNFSSNIAGGYDDMNAVTNGLFVAPADGDYIITFSCRNTGGNNTYKSSRLKYSLNGQVSSRVWGTGEDWADNGPASYITHGTLPIRLSENDEFAIVISQNGSAITMLEETSLITITMLNNNIVEDGFSSGLDIDVDFYDEFLNVDASDKDKHFNILSPLNYSVILPALEDVELTDIFKFKNLNDSTLKGLFVPVVGEKIENQTEFELFGRGTLALRKKYNENGAFWSIVEISNLFDHVGQGKSKEIAFNDHSGALEIVHNRGYRPIIKIYVADGIGGYSEADVDIDHNENQNSFIVNLEGVNTGFVRYV